MIVRCITNRHLSVQDYFTQIEQIAKARPEALIIREKDLPEPEYECLAAKVLAICTQYEVPCIFHTYVQAAIRLGVPCVHLPLQALLDLPLEQKQQLTVLGASVHSKKRHCLQNKRALRIWLLAMCLRQTANPACRRGAFLFKRSLRGGTDPGICVGRYLRGACGCVYPRRCAGRMCDVGVYAAYRCGGTPSDVWGLVVWSVQKV